jgi:hypothetical protein
MGNRKLCWPGGMANLGSTSIVLQSQDVMTIPCNSLYGVNGSDFYSMTMRGAARCWPASEIALQMRAPMSR